MKERKAIRKGLALALVFVLVAAVFVIVVPMNVGARKKIQWFEDIDLTGELPEYVNPQIAVGPDDSIHMIIGPDTDDDEWENQLDHLKSTDGGETWSERTMIVNVAPLKLGVPALAIDSKGGIHVAWMNAIGSTTPPWKIMYSKSTDGGNTWSTPIRLCEIGAFPRIAIDSNDNIFIIWTKGGIWIGFTMSSDGGDTWTTEKWIDGPPNFTYPDIATGPDDTIYVSMRSNFSPYGSIYVITSDDFGATWTSREEAYTGVASTSGVHSILVTSDGTVHIIVRDIYHYIPGFGYANHLYHVQKPSGGSWSSPVEISDLTPIYDGSWRDVVTADPYNNLYLFGGQWTDPSDYLKDFIDIYLLKYDADDDTWSERERLTFEPGHQGSPAIGMDSIGNLHLAYVDYDQHEEHYIKTSIIGILLKDIKDMDLNLGIETSLCSKLDNAQKSVDNGRYKTALNQLNALINAVNAQYGKKIPKDLADNILDVVSEIMGIIEAAM